jgi:hypothetical protein
MAAAPRPRRLLGSLLGALLCASSATALAAESEKNEIELFDYTVKPGDNCKKLAFQFFGSRERIDVLHKFNKGLGELGGKVKEHRLIPGQHLKILVPKPDARISFVRNDVETQTPETAKGRLKQPLHKGNKVATRADSAAELTLKTRTTLQMGDHTLLVVFGPIQRKGEKGDTDKAQLVSGKLRAHLGALIGKPAPTLVVQTPAAEAVVRANSPGEAAVEVGPKGETRVTVYKGTTTVAARGKSVKVEPGFALQVPRGKPPEPPRRIPVMPRWTMTPPTLILTQTASGGVVHAEFDDGQAAPAGGAPRAKVDRWHVQLARDPAFNDLVMDRQEPMGTRQIDADRLEPGTYHARVSAVDTTGFEGPATPVASFAVALASVVAGARRRESRISVSAPASVLCGLDGGRMGRPVGELVIKRNVAHRIRCAAGGGPEVALDLPRQSLGPVRMAVTFKQAAGIFGRGQLRVSASDAAGTPIEDLQLRSNSTVPGVAIASLRAEGGRTGSYVAEVSYPLTVSRLDFRLAAEDSPSVENVIFEVVAPPPPPKSFARVELGVAPIFALSSGVLGAGGGVTVEAAVGFQAGPGRLVVSARPGWERYNATHTGPVPCATQGNCGFPNSSSYSFSVSENAFTVPVLALYRLERAAGRQAIYVGAGPVLTFNSSTTFAPAAMNEDSRVRVGGAGLLGGHIQLARRTFFFAEVQGRYLPLDHPALSGGTLGWLTIGLGFRFAIN